MRGHDECTVSHGRVLTQRIYGSPVQVVEQLAAPSKRLQQTDPFLIPEGLRNR